MPFSHRTIAILLLILAGASPLQAVPSEEGTILRGRVYDAETGEPVTYAYLHIEELNRTATAHVDGTYEFADIPAGNYTLTVYRVGYQTVTRSVALEPDRVTEIDIKLRASVMSSGAVTVLGERDASVGSGLEHASRTIRGSDLRRDLAGTLAKTLENLPGLSSRKMGAAPARPVLRGLGGERVLLLQDGERTGDISGQSSDHAVTVDPMAAEQVEIARGPAALRYGSNAIGGVINVVRNQIASSRPDHLHGSASLQGETVSSGGVGSLEAGIPLGNFALQLDGNLRSAGEITTPSGPLTNSELFSANSSAGLSYIGPWGYAGVAGSAYFNEYGIPPDPEGGHPNGVTIDLRKYQAETRSELFIDHPVWKAVDFDYSYKNYFHREFESKQQGIIGSEYGVLTSNASLSARHDSLGLFSSGTIGLWGEAKDYAVSGANTPASDAYKVAAYLVEEADVGNLHLELGARFDLAATVPENEDPDSRIGHIRKRTFQALSSSISAIYRLDERFYVGTVLMHSFRAPSQEELYSEGPHLASYSYEIGNPDLGPERGFGKELFLRFRGERLNMELTGYHNGFDGYIFPRNTGRPSIRFPSLNEYQFTGVDAEIYGAELFAELQLAPALAVKGDAAYTLGKRALTPVERQIAGQDAADEQPLPMIPPLKGSLTLSYGRQSLQTGARARWAGRQERTGDFETPTAGYLVWDLFGQYRFQAGEMMHTVTLSADNLLNTTYRSHLSRIKDLFPEPGRSVSLLYRIYF